MVGAAPPTIIALRPVSSVLPAPQGLQEFPERENDDALRPSRARLEAHADVAFQLLFLGEGP